MRFPRRLLSPAVATLAAVSALGLAVAPAARADTIGTIKNLTGFHQMVVDTADGYIFFSESLNSSSALIVTGLAGNYITTLEGGGDGVEGIALSPGGKTLYAALSSKGQVAAISIASIKSGKLTQTLYSLPSPDVPYGVAEQAGKLWVSANDGTTGGGFLGSFDLSAASPAFTADPLHANWYSAPDLAADPSDAGLLVAANPGIDPTTAVTLDASTGSVLGGPAFLPTAPGAVSCGFEQQLAVVPGTNEFTVACQEQDALLFSATSLSAPQRSYAISGGSDSVSVAADGTVAVGNSSGADVYLADGTLANILPASSPFPNDAGLAISSDGTRLYALIANDDGTFSLRVFDNPEITRSSLTLNANPVTVPGPVTVTGQLGLSTGVPLPQDTAITVTAKAPNGTKNSKSVTPAADGTFSVPEDLTALGNYTITATYLGDKANSIAGTTASAPVQVALSVSGITLTGPTAVPPVKRVSIAGQLDFGFGTPAAGTPISVKRANPNKTVTTLSPVKTSAGGAFTITDKPPATGTYTYTASYAGSPTTTKASATFTVKYAKLRPGLTLNTGGTTAGYKSTITVTAHLSAPYANHVVSLCYQLAGTGVRKLLRTGKVDSSGNLTASFRSATRNVIFSAAFAGDAEYAARTVTVHVGIEVRLAMSNSGWYTSNSYGGQTYRVYHHTGHLNFSIAVTPDKHGQCVQVYVEQLIQGAWFYNHVFGCFSLNSASKFAGYLGLTNAAGARYRAAAIFNPSKSDVTNVSTQGAWFYFEVVK